jgi:hypothetical protein
MAVEVLFSSPRAFAWSKRFVALSPEFSILIFQKNYGFIYFSYFFFASGFKSPIIWLVFFNTIFLGFRFFSLI